MHVNLLKHFYNKTAIYTAKTKIKYIKGTDLLSFIDCSRSK